MANLTIPTGNHKPGISKTETVLCNIQKKFHTTYSTILYVVPTNVLKESIIKRLVQKGIKQTFIHSLFSEEGDQHSVADKIINFMKENANNDYIMFVSNKSYQMMGHKLNGFDYVVIDEDLNSFSFEQLVLSEDSSFITFNKYIMAQPTQVKNISKLVLKDTKDFNEEDMTSYVIYQKVVSLLQNKTHDIFVFTDQYEKISDNAKFKVEIISQQNQGKKGVSITLYRIFRPSCILNNKEVVYIGYNIQNTVSSLVYRSKLYNVEFKVSDIFDGLVDNYENKINIYHIFDNNKVGKKKIDENENLQKQITESLKDYAEDCLYRWQFEKSLMPNFFNSHEIPAVSHGLNNPDWMEKTTVILMNVFRTGPVLSMFLQALGYTPRDEVIAQHINMCVQQIARGALRKKDGSEIDVFVIDRETADELAIAFSGSDVGVYSLGEKATRKIRSDKNPEEYKKEYERLRAKKNRLEQKKANKPERFSEKDKMALFQTKLQIEKLKGA